MLRQILVCLDDKPSNETCRDAAIRFAGGYGANVTGLYVHPPPPAPFPVEFPMSGAGSVPPLLTPRAIEEYERMVQDQQAEEDQREERTVRRFAAECERRGLTARYVVRMGHTNDEIVSAARATDLVVFGRGDSPGLLGSTAGWLVRRLARPVMLVTGELRPISRIGVAYDGSHGADRALALAADAAFNWKDGDVEVVLIGATTEDGATDSVLRPAEAYLDAYHLAHTSHFVVGPVADTIREVATREDVDLLAMGAYGHSFLREAMLGSTTQSVIDRWPRPLLLWR